MSRNVVLWIFEDLMFITIMLLKIPLSSDLSFTHFFCLPLYICPLEASVKSPRPLDRVLSVVAESSMQNGSSRKKNLHHYSEELTLKSKIYKRSFSTFCTVKPKSSTEVLGVL